MGAIVARSKIQPCPVELSSYLSTSYTCVPGSHSNCNTLYINHVQQECKNVLRFLYILPEKKVYILPSRVLKTEWSQMESG